MSPDDDILLVREIREKAKAVQRPGALSLLIEMLGDLLKLKGGGDGDGDVDPEAMSMVANIVDLIRARGASLPSPDAAMLAILGLDMKGAESFTSRQVSSELAQAGLRPANITTVMDSLKAKGWIVEQEVGFNKHKTFRMGREGRASALRLFERLK